MESCSDKASGGWVDVLPGDAEIPEPMHASAGGDGAGDLGGDFQRDEVGRRRSARVHAGDAVLVRGLRWSTCIDGKREDEGCSGSEPDEDSRADSVDHDGNLALSGRVEPGTSAKSSEERR